jgi:hypothetical protein
VGVSHHAKAAERLSSTQGMFIANIFFRDGRVSLRVSILLGVGLSLLSAQWREAGRAVDLKRGRPLETGASLHSPGSMSG